MERLGYPRSTVIQVYGGKQFLCNKFLQATLCMGMDLELESFFWFNTWFDNPSLAVQLQILFNYAGDCQAKVCKFMD